MHNAKRLKVNKPNMTAMAHGEKWYNERRVNNSLTQLTFIFTKHETTMNKQSCCNELFTFLSINFSFLHNSQ